VLIGSLRLAFWAALLFALVMALLPQPPRLPGSPSDKVQHILAFAVLTALALAAYPRASWVKIGLGLATVGGFIELAQLIPALGREGSWLDFGADCGAVAVVLAAGLPIRRAVVKRLGRPPSASA
jgi:hypothetical protein